VVFSLLLLLPLLLWRHFVATAFCLTEGCQVTTKRCCKLPWTCSTHPYLLRLLLLLLLVVRLLLLLLF
jgi:hypothetical protein